MATRERPLRCCGWLEDDNLAAENKADREASQGSVTTHEVCVSPVSGPNNLRVPMSVVVKLHDLVHETTTAPHATEQQTVHSTFYKTMSPPALIMPNLPLSQRL